MDKTQAGESHGPTTEHTETNVAVFEEKNLDNKDGSLCTIKSKKRRSSEGGIAAKRRRRHSRYRQPKNALMQLNELKPGLKYVLRSQEGPSHDPVFFVSVEVNNETFTGRGSSKRLAKHAAAEAALSSFVQFRDMPEAMYAISKHIQNADFTDDNVENESAIFNTFESEMYENEFPSVDVTVMSDPKLTNKLHKVINEVDKKNAVMLLNELHVGLKYSLVRENASIPSQRFVMSVKVDGEEFEGVGPNKKSAKAAAARCALSKRYNVNFSSHGSCEDDGNTELFSFPQATADKIAKQISDTFTEIMTENTEYAKWKVLAGVALTKDDTMEDIQVIGIGTGTQHINGEHMSMNGASVNDCHAEVIARRCLRDYLYTQLELHVEGEGEQSVFEKTVTGKFQLKPNHRFHFFISTSPCGDARIFSVHDGEDNAGDVYTSNKARGLLRTKIESGEGTVPAPISHTAQTWDGIMQKQQRYLTMSCSDKIASWNILGVQGCLLSHFMEPVYMHSIILGRLFHRSHIYRAVCGRLESNLKDLPPPYQLHKPKLCATTTLETRQLAKPPNFSVNWTVGLGRPEIIISKTGKLATGQVSRLAKKSFFLRFSNIYNAFSDEKLLKPQAYVYADVKSIVCNYRKAKEEMQRAFAGAGLGNWVRKPSEQDEFELTF